MLTATPGLFLQGCLHRVPGIQNSTETTEIPVMSPTHSRELQRDRIALRTSGSGTPRQE